MGQPSHAAVAAIAAFSDAEATQVLYQITVWLITAVTHETAITAQRVVDQIMLFASQHRGGR